MRNFSKYYKLNIYILNIYSDGPIPPSSLRTQEDVSDFLSSWKKIFIFKEF